MVVYTLVILDLSVVVNLEDLNRLTAKLGLLILLSFH
jgi:hypothetical protein